MDLHMCVDHPDDPLVKRLRRLLWENENPEK